MADKTPKVVSEAQAAMRAMQLRMLPIVAFMCFGWLPLIAFEDGSSGMLAVMVVYLVGTLLATAGIVWDSYRTQWARELVESWKRIRIDARIKDAMQTDGVALPGAAMMGRIREHLEVDARALRAAEQAFERLQRLVTEEHSASAALADLPEGTGRDQLAAAVARLKGEADEIQSSLAALYASLLTRNATPAYEGLKDTMAALEAEAEVATDLLDEQARRNALARSQAARNAGSQ